MTIDLHIPENWSQVTAEQLRTIVELTHSELSREDFLLVLLCRFTGIRMVAGTTDEDNRGVVRTGFKDAEGNFFEMEDWQVSDFCSRLSFALKEMPRDIVCPFKWHRRLIATTFGDWFQADALMLRYFTTQDPQYVEGAMRCLGDPHENPSTVDIELMRIWWEDFQGWMIEKYPYIFKKTDPRKESVISPLETRQNIMLMLNDRRPQDNVKIEESNLHDVLSALQYKIEEAEEKRRMLNRQ